MRPSSSNPGSFVPTTNIWDVNSISDLGGVSPDLKELLVRLYQNLNRMSIVLNGKDTGIYSQSEFTNGQVYFPQPANNSSTLPVAAQRQVQRVVVNFGALPLTSTKSVPHNINPNGAFTFTRIYGCATEPGTNYIPLPYSSATLIDNIELSADTVNVNITTAADYSAYTVTYVILEYLKS